MPAGWLPLLDPRQNASAEDLEAQIGDLARIVAARLAQLDGCGPGNAEQPDAVAQQHWHRVDEDLIHEPGAMKPSSDIVMCHSTLLMMAVPTCPSLTCG